jgi:hypothetical protein
VGIKNLAQWPQFNILRMVNIYQGTSDKERSRVVFEEIVAFTRRKLMEIFSHDVLVEGTSGQIWNLWQVCDYHFSSISAM